MPEGPEVKLSADLIRPLVLNKKIYHVYVGDKSRYKDEGPDGLLDFNLYKPKVTNIETKGKFMYWTFDNGWYMFCTFGMSGQWSPVIGKHPCLIFQFQNSHDVIFNDPRHFGTIKFVNNKQDLSDKLNTLGWDPLQDNLKKYEEYLRNKLKNNKPIGQMLMDQSLFSGVGNYIRAESLYAAKMSPWRKSCDLTSDEINRLCYCIIQVMKDSYDHQGATILTYKNAYGAEGKYSSCFKVYGHKKDPSGNVIIRENTPDGRTMHWCPAIQI